MILVLAGTSEGREMVKLLLEEELPVMATVTTPYGAEILKKQGLEKIIVARQTKESFSVLLQQEKVQLVIDATHPFATEVSYMALQVTKDLDIQYIRLERKREPLPEHKLLKICPTLESGVEEALILGKNVFSALGSKHLEYIWNKVKEKEARLIARVLPTPKVLQSCFDLGLEPQQIIALKGPFSKNLNKAIFIDYGADVIITKESGQEGGFQQKIAAALELNIPCVVWQRPQLNYPLVCHSPREVLTTWKN